jgi:predicted small metal-binding protein
MSQQIRCECGYIARANSDDEVVALIREHMRTDHPELLNTISEDQIRDWIEVVG